MGHAKGIIQGIGFKQEIMRLSKTDIEEILDMLLKIHCYLTIQF